MYEAFYHLNTNPFRITPDPKFCFSHSGYKSAREYLDYALRLGEGFIMVTGRPGTGKTTLAETFLKDLDLARVSAERVSASGLEADDMLRAVAYAYGIDAKSLDKATLRRRIQQYFIQQKHCGRRALLIIDEAHGLPYSALEELRLLADLQAGSRPLLQLFLVGQEKLRDLMCTPEMEQFQQRIIATCHLKPLDLWETRAYVGYRLCQAGWKGDPELTGAALLAIYQWSRGVPRQINKISNRLLLLGYGKGKHALAKEDVQAVSVELREEQLTPLGSGQETPAENSTSRPMEEHEDGVFSLSKLALRMNSEDVEKPLISVARAPVSRPEMHAATRQTQQAMAWRVQAAAKARRERQPVKSSASRGSSVSGPGRVYHRYGFGLVRLFTCRNRSRLGVALWVAALVVASLFAVGLSRLSGEERTDRANLPGEHRALIKPSMLTHGGRQENTEIMNPQTRKHGLVTQAQDDIPVATPEELQGQASDATQDGSEITGPEVSHNDVAMAASNRVLPNFEFTDPPAAGNRAGKMVPADDHPAPPPVSRKEKIAVLLSLGQQSLRQFRLLTPAGNNAYHYFQEVLVLDPGNTDARDGLYQIVDRYVKLAKRANKRQNPKLARVYLSRGLRVQPGNRELIALQDSMREPPVIPRETITRASPDVEPQPQQVNFFSRLKSLFTNGQWGPAEIIERPITSVNP